jgi:ATP-dependent DNA helicase RecQ
MKERYPNGRGVIFCRTQDETEALASLFQGVPYHASLNSKDRRANSTAFIDGVRKLMCATTAFGVGVDIPNIRFSIHAGSPYTLRDFVQQSGRIGRDGLPSTASIVYSTDDPETSAANLKGKDPIFEFLRMKSSCLRAVMSQEFDGFPHACFVHADTAPCQNCRNEGFGPRPGKYSFKIIYTY